jgi:hypothetical protein
MDAATIGAIAALLTAAAGLAKILFSKDTGKPWVTGVVTLGIVGGVLLLVALDGPGDGSPAGNESLVGTSQEEYQRQVRAICDEDRGAEVAFKHQLEGIQQDLMAGDLTALVSVVSAMTDTIVKEQGLAGRLDALDPPSALQTVQSEAVAGWNRKLAVSRRVRDQLARNASDPAALATAMANLNASEESQLESEKDVLLGRLGGAGCDPSP